MAHVRLIEVDEAAGPLKEEYDAAVGRAGEVFNIVKAMSLRPGVLSRSLELYKASGHPTATIERVPMQTTSVQRAQTSRSRAMRHTTTAGPTWPHRFAPCATTQLSSRAPRRPSARPTPTCSARRVGRRRQPRRDPGDLLLQPHQPRRRGRRDRPGARVEREGELTMTGFTIVHVDDFERPFPKWALARKSLDLQSFGMNVVELPPGETIPEHDETASDQEEVFIVLSGEATMVIDGEDHPAPAGTYARLDPEPRRTVANRSEADATVLIVSAPRTSGYTPMDWA